MIFKNRFWYVLQELQKQPAEVFYKKAVLKNFAKFTGTPVKFLRKFKNIYFEEHLRATASGNTSFQFRNILKLKTAILYTCTKFDLGWLYLLFIIKKYQALPYCLYSTKSKYLFTRTGLINVSAGFRFT